MRTRTVVVLATVAMLSRVQVAAQEQSATKEELEEVKGILQSINESAAEYRNYVDALRKIKITGYVQAQFRYTDVDNVPYDIGTFSGGRFPQYSKNVFQLRRARVKVNYDNALTQFVVQMDLGQTLVGLKDAYLSLTEPWLQSLTFTMGVFDRPFGYEISYSSGNRETPERSRMYQTLNPGEREMGAKLSFAPQLGSLSFLKAEIGLFNGGGPASLEFDNFKDIIGRVGAQFPFDDLMAELDLGLSGYFGKVRSGSSDVYAMGPLTDGSQGFLRNRDTTNFGNGYTRRYVGVDAQLYYDVPALGGLILRGEYIMGKQPGVSATSVSLSSLPTVPLYLRKFNGWYLSLVQNIGSQDQVMVKYDAYDPNTDVTGGTMTPAGGFSAADLRFSTLGFGAIHHWDDNLKFVLYYEVVRNETVDRSKIPTGSLSLYGEDVKDNVLTFRVQYKF